MKKALISHHGKTLTAAACAAAALCLACAASFAADDPPAAAAASPRATAAADPLAGARQLIRQERWRDAIAELQRTNQTGSADWHNLMGYSYRKAKTPDLAAAQRHYDAALTIDPRHRGALEYSGELFLTMNDLPAARQRLASLEAVCGRNCAEYEQLRSAIAGFEAKPRN